MRQPLRLQVFELIRVRDGSKPALVDAMNLGISRIGADLENADVGKMEAELRQWGGRLDNLLAMADLVGTAARIDYRRRLDDAREKYDAAEAKLAELKAAGRDKWEICRGGVENAWSELATAFTRLTT